METVFLKLLNMSISASWLVLAVLLLRLVLKRMPKAIHCALWALVAVRLLCPVSVESELSLLPSAETVPEEIFFAQEPEIHTGITSLNQVVNPIITETYAPNPMASVNPIQIQMWIWGVIWVIGLAVMLFYAAASYFRICRKVCTAVRMEDGVWQSEQVGSPFILGIIKPRIYLPFAMEPEQMKYVLAHERAHLKRKDHWWKPLGFLLLAIHWFNPLMWVAYILLCRDIELACDEKVIKDMGTQEKKDYSHALLLCSVPRRMIAVCPLAFGEVGVKTRIKSVLNYKKPAFWAVAVGIVAGIVLAVCFLTNPYQTNGKIIVDGVIYYQLAEESKELPLGSRQIGRLLGLEKGEPTQHLYGAEIREKYVGCPIFQNGTNDEIIYLVIGNGVLTFVSEKQEEKPEATPGFRMILDDVRELAKKGEALTWSDFDEFSYYETGSGLYIRVYEIDGMFELRIGGTDLTLDPMYIYLTANDGRDNLIDIRTGDVEEFIATHKDNPIVVDCPYSWECSPVGYNEEVYWEMFRQGGNMEKLYLSSTRFAPVVQIRSREELDTFTEKMNGRLDFEHTRAQAPAFSKVMAQFDEVWFESRDVFLLYLTAGQLEDRFAAEWVRKSDGQLSIAVQEQAAEVSEQGQEGWLMAVSVPKEQLEDVYKTTAFVNSRVTQEGPLSAAIRETVLTHFRKDVPEGLYTVESHQILDMTRKPYVHPVTGKESIHITVYTLILEQAFSIDENGGLVSEPYGGHCPKALTFEVTENGEYLLKEYWTLRDDAYDEVNVIKNFPPHVAAEAMDLERYIHLQMQDCYHQMIQEFGLDPLPTIKALLDEVDSDVPKGREPSVEAVAEFAPVEVYRELIYYGGYTMNYIREERARGKCSPWRETIMKAVEEDIISTTGIHGNPVFRMTYEATPEEEIVEKIQNNELVITTTHHQLADGTWRTEQYSYKYRLEITGRLNNAARDSTYIILSNTDDITFDQAWKASGLSSNMNDYFDPANAKIVGFR